MLILALQKVEHVISKGRVPTDMMLYKDYYV